MKKLLLLLLTVLLCSSLYAQKRVYVYNYSSYDMDMSYLYTIPNLSYDFGNPNVMSEQPLIWESGHIYSYVSINELPNVSKFPYSGFANMTWDPNPGNGGLSGTVAESLYGAGQKFYFMKVSGRTFGYDGGNLGQDYGVSQDFISGDNVDFYFVENYLSATEIEYTIMMLDN